MLNLIAAGSLVASLLVSPIVIDPGPSVPDEQITIDVITVNGSGCPAGTTAVAVAPDNTAFTVTYSEYFAQVGVGSVPNQARRNCQLAVDVHVPGGFTYAISKTDYRGYGSLAKGASATQMARYYFQGQSPTSYASHAFRGPFDDNWQTSDEVEIASQSWYPCGEQRYLNINTELRVAAGTSDVKNTTSVMWMDSTDGSISTKYHFNWKRCDED
ncbi:DUF4360 domain-containing protein [Jidongwangia harbinensis]|uniref:DUF4360 domain-containing protein n=1 Tax=Jidongwangia harbinensis TaxID=2878561 RepID=UPI001CD9C1FB|nr:DUF4360 domain-containing protein [Jidongwangia harbinensis]MCA2213296.1 DUF4360 domain-containing protein [Jidongwangia harbinensis]